MIREGLGKSLRTTLDHSIHSFIDRLHSSSYPFALWRLPQGDKSFILVDISNSGANSKNLEELEACFIINPYEKNHPTQPKVLNGDIIIELSGEKSDIHFSPTISSSQIEEFIGEMEGSDEQKSNTIVMGPTSPSSSFKDKIAETVRYIKNGEALKIVLSRYEDHQLPESFQLYDCYQQVKEAYPNAFCYLLSTSEHGTWIGASPEKLVSIEDKRIFKTEALAGTQLLPEHGHLGEVAWTQKEIEEQAMVSRYIIDCLKKIRLREFEETGPKTVQAGKLVHLKTEYRVDMEETNTPDLGSIMMDLLHPTSAVCGMPHPVAREYIKKHEGYDRALYAGFLGPVNFNKGTHLFVNLRCMQIVGKTARLYAGAGITADSNPEKEWAETVNKMKTLLDVLH